MVAFLGNGWGTSGSWDLGKRFTMFWWGTRGGVLMRVCECEGRGIKGGCDGFIHRELRLYV